MGYQTEQKELYPPFLTWYKSNNVLVFSPDSETYAGKTYKFFLVVREKGADVNKHVYHVSVIVASSNLELAEEQITNNDSVRAINESA